MFALLSGEGKIVKRFETFRGCIGGEALRNRFEWPKNHVCDIMQCRCLGTFSS